MDLDIIYSFSGFTNILCLGTIQPELPSTFEIAIYLQDTFNGPADGTCAWGVVSSHEGDIRNCPAGRASPSRPPERGLSSNLTSRGEH